MTEKFITVKEWLPIPKEVSVVVTVNIYDTKTKSTNIANVSRMVELDGNYNPIIDADETLDIYKEAQTIVNNNNL